jgi:hypothetical protein
MQPSYPPANRFLPIFHVGSGKKPSKGHIMSEYLESNDIKQLMAEADELVKRIDADAIKERERGASLAG